MKNLKNKILSIFLLIGCIFLLISCSCSNGTVNLNVKNILDIKLSQTVYYNTNTLEEVYDNIEYITVELDNGEIKNINFKSIKESEYYVSSDNVSLFTEITLQTYMTNLIFHYKNLTFDLDIDIKCSHQGGQGDCNSKPICMMCGQEYGIAEHKWEASTHVEATGNSRGYTLYKCENCNESKIVYDD